MPDAETTSEHSARRLAEQVIAQVIQPLKALSKEACDLRSVEGRERISQTLRNAQFIGKMTVTFGSREAMRRVQDLVESMVAPPGPTTGDEASPAPEPPEVVPTSPVASRHGEVDVLIPGYDDLSASQVVKLLSELNSDELATIAEYEAAGRSRRTILNRITQLSQALSDAS